MTDREMLELAARAIDVCFSECLEYDVQGKRKGPFIVRRGKWVEWNPLTDDGDALRLAVDLAFINDQSWPLVSKELLEECRGNWQAATRRAIVRAAAEIGKAMP